MDYKARLKEEVEQLEDLVEVYRDLKLPPPLAHELGWYMEKKRDELVGKLKVRIKELENLKFE